MRGRTPWNGLQADIGDKQLGKDALVGPLPDGIEHHLQATIGILAEAQDLIVHSQREPLLEACMHQALHLRLQCNAMMEHLQRLC